MFKCSEGLARNRQQLKFLKSCKSASIYPKTIANIHLPSMFKSERLTPSADQIKRTILSKMIRNLYYECHKAAQNLRTFNNDARAATPHQASDIINASKEAFHRAKQFHYRRLTNKLHLLLRKDNPAHDPVHDQDHTPTPHNEKVTDMTGNLTEQELDLLSKGPKFALKTKPDESCKLNIQTSFCRLAYQLRWMDNLPANEETTNSRPYLPKLQQSSSLNKPPINNPELETKLKLAYNDIQKATRTAQFTNSKPNLKKEHLTTIKRLKQHPYTYLPSDKGGEFCVIETTRYDHAAHQHLSDTSTYKKINRMSAGTMEAKINAVWKQVGKDANLNTRDTRMYVTNNSTLPKFYHLIKTHKNTPEIKIRPIVSGIGGPAYKISWLLNQLLKTLLQSVPAHLENSLQLMESIQGLSNNQRKKFNFPFSLDVVSLYTSVPPDEAIANIHRRLETDPTICRPLKPQHVRSLLQVILNNTFFEYKGEVYQQISGLPMGSNISGLLAILFMDTLETQALRHNQHLGIYRRYVDDTCILTTSREEAEHIFQSLNAQHPAIKFETEYPNEDNSLALLDFRFTITPSGDVTFEFYQKKAKKDLFPHAQSAMPTRIKTNIARNEIERRTTRCSTTEGKVKHTNIFKETLTLNGYNDDEIRSITNKTRNRPNRQAHIPTSKTAFFNFPYINDALDRKITNIFKKHELPVRVYRRSYTLRHALRNKPTPYNCNLASCDLKNEHCLTKNCVYCFTCDKCKQKYIGSTIRQLHKRYREHTQDSNSSIFKHTEICRSSYTTTVLAREPDNVNLRFKEAILIAKHSPAINSKIEKEELLYLIF